MREVALRKESVDRNYTVPAVLENSKPSLSARRAWIEILTLWYSSAPSWVALRKESVDRNRSRKWLCGCPLVALRKESVDRNVMSAFDVLAVSVALRKESVDRNQHRSHQS